MTHLPTRLFAACLAWLFLTAVTGRPPEGPVPILWDQETCEECHMHIGEPRFAAQLQTRDQELFNFDDAGCLFRYLRAHPNTPIHAIWFRHSEADRWVASTHVHFVTGQQTPMGSGLAAVDVAREGSLSFAAAKRRSVNGGTP